MPRPYRTIYQPELTPREHNLFNKALRTDGLDQEIALIRTRIASLAAHSDPNSGGSIEENRLLARMMETLTAMLRVKYGLAKTDDDLDDNIRRINDAFLKKAAKTATAS